MDIAEARRRMAAKRSGLTRHQKSGLATRLARAERNWQILRVCTTMDEACRRTGLTVHGVRAAFRRHTGALPPYA